MKKILSPMMLLEATGLCSAALLVASGQESVDSGNPGREGKGLASWVNPPPVKSADEWTPTRHAFQESERAPLVSMGPDGRLVYKPYADRGDRIIDFSYCGYRRSEVPIPDVPVVVTLSPPPGEAKPHGPMKYPIGPDSHKTIQEALDRVAARDPDAQGFRGAVLLRKGTWYVNGGLQVGSGVVLRGEGDGEDGTILIVTIPDGNGVGVQLGGGGEGSSSEAFTPVTGTLRDGAGSPEIKIADAYVPSGATRLTLSDASWLKAGDVVRVVKTTNAKWIEVLGVGERLKHIRGGKEGAGKKPWSPMKLSHTRRITGVHGNTVTLDVMLPQSIDANHGGGYVQKAAPSSRTSRCGVEHLRIVSNYDTAQKSNDKDANYGNLRNGIGMSCVDGWARNCTVLHVWFAAVAPGDSEYSTVRDCKSLQPIGAVRGGKRYTYSMAGGTGILVYRCSAEDGRHDFAVGARTNGPNAFVRCTAVRGEQSEPHHRWGVGILYDNVALREGGTLAAINRGDSGSGHGWAAANTVIWNCAAENIVVFDPETEGENNFAIGYTGPPKEGFGIGGLWYANTRAGYWGTPKEGKYYGYAVMGNGHIESPGRPVKPDSLFEQQLIDRIGRAKAEAVLK